MKRVLSRTDLSTVVEEKGRAEWASGIRYKGWRAA